jgi:hypothetical protein
MPISRTAAHHPASPTATQRVALTHIWTGRTLVYTAGTLDNLGEEREDVHEGEILRIRKEIQTGLGRAKTVWKPIAFPHVLPS